MRQRTTQMIYEDLYLSALYAEKRKTNSICDNCAVSDTCKYHNNPKNRNKVVKDCEKFKLSDDVLKIIEGIWRKEVKWVVVE